MSEKVGRQFSEDRRRLESMRNEHLKLYEGQFVAMYHGRFFHAPDHDALFKLLAAEDVGLGHAVIRFLTSQPRVGWHA